MAAARGGEEKGLAIARGGASSQSFVRRGIESGADARRRESGAAHAAPGARRAKLHFEGRATILA
jgi:hypothetical protein